MEKCLKQSSFIKTGSIRLAVYSIITTCISCVSFAPPSPLMTYGGPNTTSKKGSEVVMAVGTGIALFDKAHSGATGYFGRYKYGLSEKFDIGVDLYGGSRSDGGTLAAKIATRYQLSYKSRLEFSIGAADDSEGKSVNSDIAITFGSRKDKPWNYYSSLRVSYALGVAGNAVNLPGQTRLKDDDAILPNTVFALLNLGTQGKVSKYQKVLFEGGYGYIIPYGKRAGPGFYISVGLLFNIEKQKVFNKY